MSQLLTLKQTAEKMSVEVRTLRKWIRDGKLAGIKMPNGDWRIRESFLENWLDKRTVKARAV